MNAPRFTVTTEGRRDLDLRQFGEDFVNRLWIPDHLTPAQAAGLLDQDDKARMRQLVLEIGAAGQLLATKELAEVLPLEDRQALKDAKPEVKDGEVTFDPAKVEARQKAMVANLPKEGLAVIILGGSHDLGPHLPVGTLYLQVTPQTYPVPSE